MTTRRGATIRAADIEGDPAAVAAIFTYFQRLAQDDPARTVTVGQVDQFYHMAVAEGRDPDEVREAIGLPPVATSQLTP